MKNDQLLPIIAIAVFCAVCAFAVSKLNNKVDEPVQLTEKVFLNETWVEDTYYNGKWFIVSLIIGETNQRQFQFRSVDSADAWLKSLLESPKYDVVVRDWFYVHGKE
jgi:hypothetical protein